MNDIVITWHDWKDDVVCAVMYVGDYAPTEQMVVELSLKVPVQYSTIIVSVTPHGLPEPMAMDIYQRADYGYEN